MSVENKETYQDPQVPARKRFVKANAYLKAQLIKLNPAAESIDYTDLKATVNHAERKITLALKDGFKNRYKMEHPIELTYSEIDFNALITETLGFQQTFSAHQKDEVIAALPVGLSHTWEDVTGQDGIVGRLNVTVTPTGGELQFGESDVSLVTMLFQDKTYTFEFLTDFVNLEEKFTAKDITVVLADLVEEIPAGEPSSAVAA